MNLFVALLIPFLGIGLETSESLSQLVDSAEYVRSSDTVLQWERQVKVVSRMGAHEVLALIHVESTGNPYARRPRSRFYGLLQISDVYAKDAFEFIGKKPKPASSLIGDGEQSLQVFKWYMTRYEHIHKWDDEKIAVLHKAGPTGLRRILHHKRRTKKSFHHAVCSYNKPSGVCTYLTRYKSYKEIYETKVDSGRDT